jgi:hypothetical protein
MFTKTAGAVVPVFYAEKGKVESIGERFRKNKFLFDFQIDRDKSKEINQNRNPVAPPFTP